MVISGAKTFRREQLQGASTHMKSKYVQLACMLVLASGALAIRSVPLLATSAECASLSARNLYAVNQSSKSERVRVSDDSLPRPGFKSAAVYFEWLAQKETRDYDRQQRLLEVGRAF